MGCDATPMLNSPELIAISIHAPTWGATQASKRARMAARHFNPRTHVGCDRFSDKLDQIVLNFNPRTHMGCDIKPPPRASRPAHFNPRTHMGCDYRSKMDIVGTFIISIHAPTWGATYAADPDTHEAFKFQSTHPHGVRPEITPIPSGLYLFQSTHPHGVRHHRVHIIFLCFISIHAPTWGATTLSAWDITCIINFNPRTHMGCDLIILQKL